MIIIYTYKVLLKEFSKFFKCLASSSIHAIEEQLDLLFNALHREANMRKKRILAILSWALLIVIVLALFINMWFIKFS